MTVIRFRDGWTFLIDGKGDAVFDPTWGVTTFSSPEAARRAGEDYLARIESNEDNSGGPT